MSHDWCSDLWMQKKSAGSQALRRNSVQQTGVHAPSTSVPSVLAIHDRAIVAVEPTVCCVAPTGTGVQQQLQSLRTQLGLTPLAGQLPSGFCAAARGLGSAALSSQSPSSVHHSRALQQAVGPLPLTPGLQRDVPSGHSLPIALGLVGVNMARADGHTGRSPVKRKTHTARPPSAAARTWSAGPSVRRPTPSTNNKEAPPLLAKASRKRSVTGRRRTPAPADGSEDVPQASSTANVDVSTVVAHEAAVPRLSVTRKRRVAAASRSVSVGAPGAMATRKPPRAARVKPCHACLLAQRAGETVSNTHVCPAPAPKQKKRSTPVFVAKGEPLDSTTMRTFEQLSIFEQEFLKPLNEFYRGKTYIQDVILPLVVRPRVDKRMSMRLINWLASCYTLCDATSGEKVDIVYEVTWDGQLLETEEERAAWLETQPEEHKDKSQGFNLETSYHAVLARDTKTFFDPFRRGPLYAMQIDTGDGGHFITTLGQLNFMAWAIKWNVLRYASRHRDAIYDHMVKFQPPRRPSPAKRQKLVDQAVNVLLPLPPASACSDVPSDTSHLVDNSASVSASVVVDEEEDEDDDDDVAPDVDTAPTTAVGASRLSDCSAALQTPSAVSASSPPLVITTHMESLTGGSTFPSVHSHLGPSFALADNGRAAGGVALLAQGARQPVAGSTTRLTAVAQQSTTHDTTATHPSVRRRRRSSFHQQSRQQEQVPGTEHHASAPAQL